MKRCKFSLLWAIAALMLCLSACAPPRSAEARGGESLAAVTGEAISAERASAAQQPDAGRKSGEKAEEELEIHFLDVGQGDCTLLLCGGEAMLIDAGDNNQGAKIQNYLQKHDVETLKYVVCTHPDEDHIGGMDVILYKFDCETILMTEESKDTAAYRDVVDTMWNRGYERTLPVVGQQYFLGDASFTILGPSGLSDDSNNNSIALLLTHGSNRVLFTGDAEAEEEREMADSGILADVDVYKAGHHGSRTSSSEKLLEAVTPEYAVISCGEGNSYGHPHGETMNNFRSMGVQIFRTDEQGSIVLFSDGSEIQWNCSPSDTWQAGEPAGSSGQQGGIPDSSGMGRQEEPDDVAQALSYICNTNTKKFHSPDCSSVEQMKDKNRLSTGASREELIEQGYAPCKKCNP